MARFGTDGAKTRVGRDLVVSNRRNNVSRCRRPAFVVFSRAALMADTALALVTMIQSGLRARASCRARNPSSRQRMAIVGISTQRPPSVSMVWRVFRACSVARVTRIARPASVCCDMCGPADVACPSVGDKQYSVGMRVYAMAILVATLLCGCPNSKNGPPRSGHTPEAQQSMRPNVGLPAGMVVVHSQGRNIRIQVEICRTSAERATGMMFRKSLADLAGMLFVFEHSDNHTFWMKNTYLPLDMIFVSRLGEIVGIVENAAPMTTVSRSVDRKSRYVIEVNGGFCQARGIKVGDKVELPVGSAERRSL